MLSLLLYEFAVIEVEITVIYLIYVSILFVDAINDLLIVLFSHYVFRVVSYVTYDFISF